MRKILMLSAVVLSGCGGMTPEIYELVIDYFTLPDSCYSNGMQPNSTTTASPPGLMQVRVWDGPDGDAFLEIESGGATIDMGAAPNVSVRGIFTGKRSEKGWTFTSDAGEKTVAGNTTTTGATHAEFTFERAVTFKGTGALSSSATCTGTICGNNANPSCSVSGINVRGTRIATDFERAP